MKQPKKKKIASELINLAKEYFCFTFLGQINKHCCRIYRKNFIVFPKFWNKNFF